MGVLSLTEQMWRSVLQSCNYGDQVFLLSRTDSFSTIQVGCDVVLFRSPKVWVTVGDGCNQTDCLTCGVCVVSCEILLLK